MGAQSDFCEGTQNSTIRDCHFPQKLNTPPQKGEPSNPLVMTAESGRMALKKRKLNTESFISGTEKVLVLSRGSRAESVGPETAS
jgi:hypothetical protein